MTETTIVGHTATLHGGTSPAKRTPTRDNTGKKKIFCFVNTTSCLWLHVSSSHFQRFVSLITKESYFKKSSNGETKNLVVPL